VASRLLFLGYEEVFPMKKTKAKQHEGNGQTGKFVNGDENEKQLAALAARANDFHWKYHNGVRALLPYAQKAGQALIEAKALAGHGNWLEWLTHNFDGSLSTAERYMTIARHPDAIDKLLEANPKATVDEALGRIKGRNLDAMPATRATKVVVEMTRAEEARRKLRKWWDSHIMRRFTDEQIIYLSENLDDCWNAFLPVLLDEVRLANCLIPAEQRLWDALRKHGEFGCDENNPLFKRFCRELVTGLAGLSPGDLNENLRWIVLCKLCGADVAWPDDAPQCDNSFPPRRELRRLITKAIGTKKLSKQVAHVARLLNPPSTKAAGGHLQSPLADARDR
jgi:hypothetical protein